MLDAKPTYIGTKEYSYITSLYIYTYIHIFIGERGATMSVGGRLPTGPTQLRHPQGGGTMTMGREGGVPEPGTYIPMYLCVYIHIHILHTYIYICAYVCVAVYVAVCVCDNVLEHLLALSSDSQP